MYKKPFFYSLMVAFCLTTPSMAEDMGYEQDAQEDNVVLRLNGLEHRLRQQAGDIETLQYTIKQLQEQLRKFQEDVEFRFQDKKLKGTSISPHLRELKERSEKSSPALSHSGNDAFDPTQETNAVGAPKPLGSPLSAAPPPQSQITSTYEQALDSYREKAYGRSRKLFTAIMNEKPVSKHMPDVLYYLGEINYQEKNFREAGEHFLKIVVTYGKSERAPESLWKLGLSLKALGNQEQACATFIKFQNMYPKIAQNKEPPLERILKEAKCK